MPPASEILPAASPVPGDNAISHVDRLPVEILTHVFAHLVEHPGGSSDESYLLAQVCQYWRAVALIFKPLWASISDQRTLEWIKLKLMRSDPAPLTVWVSRDRDSNLKYYDKARLILEQLPRIQEMNFTVNRLYEAPGSGSLHAQGKRDMLDLLNASPAPLLRSLNIAMWDSSSDKHLSPSIFAGATPPDLKHVELFACTVPLGYHLLTAPLTHLELHLCVGWNTIDQFLDMVEGLPTLEVFLFHTDTETSRIRRVRSQRENHSVALPHLRRLSLYDDIVIIAHILRYLSFPSNVYLTIQAEDEGDSSLSPQAIANLYQPGLQPWLSSAFGEGGRFDVVDIQLLEGNEDTGFTVAATRLSDLDSDADTPSPQPRRFEFSIREFGMDNANLRIVFLQMLARLPGMANPTAVVANHTCLMDAAAHWHAVAGDWNDVTMLTLEGRVVYGFADALNDETAVLFPKLALVNIKATDLNTRRPNTAWYVDSDSDQDTEEPAIPVIDALVAALTRRIALQYPPISFMINECDVPAGKIRALKQAMGPLGEIMVVWDRKEDALTRKEARQLEMEELRRMIFEKMDDSEDEDDDDEEDEDAGE